MSDAAAMQGLGVGRPVAQRLVVVGDGAVEGALGAMGVAAAAPGRHEFRVQPDGLAVIRDGAVEIARGDADLGAAHAEFRVARIEPDRLPEIRGRPRRIALPALVVAAIQQAHTNAARTIVAGVPIFVAPVQEARGHFR
jgi:hypothetical protein